MGYRYFLDFLPLWLLLTLTIALISGAMEAGYRYGRLRRNRANIEKDAPVGAVASSTLALLGFMLAITFGIAVSRFDFRRQAFLGEVNSISTAFLFADLLPPIHRDTVRNALREYVDLRLEAAATGNLTKAIQRSDELHRLLWGTTLSAASDSPNFFAVGIFAQTLNSVFDSHTKRVFAVVDSRIPALIWIVLYVVAVVGMGELGYQAALAGSSRTPASVGLVLAFAAVLLLIADLDRPHQGLLRVGQSAMQDLKASIDRPVLAP
jgi:hypothetical protein